MTNNTPSGAKSIAKVLNQKVSTFAMRLAPLGVLFVMKALEDERSGVITAYKLAVLEILRNLAYIACPRYPYI